MARAVITAIEIHDARLFVPGGDAYDWVKGVTRETKTAAKALAPPHRSFARWPRSGTGELNRSIYGRVTSRGKILNAEIGASADHAVYVLGGTAFQGQRFIYSRLGWVNKSRVDAIAEGIRRQVRGGAQIERGGDRIRKGWAMGVRPGAGFGKSPRLRVKGQIANPFLTDGYNVTAAHHEALKPMRSRFIFN
jgi:hypothetical protein